MSCFALWLIITIIISRKYHQTMCYSKLSRVFYNGFGMTYTSCFPLFYGLWFDKCQSLNICSDINSCSTVVGYNFQPHVQLLLQVRFIFLIFCSKLLNTFFPKKAHRSWMYHISWLFLKCPLHRNAILPHGACCRPAFPLCFLLACSSTLNSFGNLS